MTACLIAGLLALTVDRQLKASIAQDAFRYLMCWVSPERLQSELESVYRQPFFAVEHHMTVNLTEITSTYFIRMTLDTQRKLRNESLQSQEYRPIFDVRKWQQLGRESAITEISADFKGHRYDQREKSEHPDKEATDVVRERLTTPSK